MNKGSHILVVDDEAISVKLITGILKTDGYAVDSCLTGEDALEKVRDERYDLVLLDVCLGRGLDGYEVCRSIQKTNSELPIILVTSGTDDEAIRKGFQIGSSDYIKKPISRYELLARVSRTLTFKRAEKNNLQLIYDLSKDLETAAKIQAAMLPKWIYLDEEMIFSSHYEAYEAVGGDVFDQIRLPDGRYVVYLGDISGHGVQAALLMTAIKSIIRIMVETESELTNLPRLVTRLNHRLSNELFIFDNYLTLLIGIIDLEKSEFRFLNAGHPPFVIIDAESGTPRVVESQGSLPLGWMDEHTYNDADMGIIPMSNNDIFLLFSDGIYECANQDGNQFGIGGIVDVLREKIRLDSCISLPYRIKQYLMDNRYNLTHDDFSLLAFQRRDTQLLQKKTAGRQAESIHFMTNLRAALREVSKTAQEVENLILNWKGDAKLAARVELIVDEFLNNIIKYGYNYRDDSTIVVEFFHQQGRLSIKFWDKGIEWTPEESEYSVNNPYNFEKDVYNVDGKGVKIIMSMSNRFHRTRHDQLNETTVDIEV